MNSSAVPKVDARTSSLVARARLVTLDSRSLLASLDDLLNLRAGLLDERVRLMGDLAKIGRGTVATIARSNWLHR